MSSVFHIHYLPFLQSCNARIPLQTKHCQSTVLERDVLIDRFERIRHVIIRLCVRC
jgi:hypothetical protein